MKRILPLLLLFLAFAACTETVRHAKALEEAEALLGSRPEEALRMLDSIGRLDGSMGKMERMRWQLLRLTAQNKCYVPFKSDSAALEVADYYDRHGTANERMAAHYLLGCAYRDMGEAPMALQCFQEAVECADTAAADCDKKLLAVINIQIGHLFYTQYLPQQALANLNKAVNLCKETGDTLLQLNAITYCMLSYYELGNYNIVDSLTDLLQREYLLAKDTIKAVASTNAALIHALQTNNTAKAHKLFDFILKGIGEKSLLNDPQWEYLKTQWGYYALKEGNTLKAEDILRPICESSSETNRIIACKGLMELYQLRHNADSVSKYATEYCMLNDSTNVFRQAQIVGRMNALYNYQRIATLAEKRKEEAEKKGIIITALLLIGIATTSAIYLYRRRERERTTQQLALQNANYNHILSLYRQTNDDLAKLKSNELQKNDLLDEKESLLKALMQKMEAMEAGAEAREQAGTENSLLTILHKKALTGTKAEIQELKGLKRDILNNDPAFMVRLMEWEKKITVTDSYICLLIRQGFTASETAILLGMKPQALSNRKKRILIKITGKDGNATHLNRLILET